jgi:hypothetical protein
MLDWLLESGIYLLGVALIPGVGLLLICSGLWGDRSKGRVRCPKCWYDMRGTLPRLECPECGHAPGDARGLCRTRRRWWRMALGVLVVLLFSYPLTIAGGWYREQAVIKEFRFVPGSSLRVEKVDPAWLVERLPDALSRFFERADWLYIDRPADLDACARLPYLRELMVSSWVSDADLLQLKGLSNLKVLIVNRIWTKAGAAELQRALPNVRILSLWDPINIIDPALPGLGMPLPDNDWSAFTAQRRHRPTPPTP